jgi:hypothetical protein
MEEPGYNNSVYFGLLVHLQEYIVMKLGGSLGNVPQKMKNLL